MINVGMVRLKSRKNAEPHKCNVMQLTPGGCPPGFFTVATKNESFAANTCHTVFSGQIYTACWIGGRGRKALPSYMRRKIAILRQGEKNKKYETRMGNCRNFADHVAIGSDIAHCWRIDPFVAGDCRCGIDC
jgi:hypothetical protein